MTNMIALSVTEDYQQSVCLVILVLGTGCEVECIQYREVVLLTVQQVVISLSEASFTQH